MVRQTQMNGKLPAESPVRVVARTAAGLWHHILTLAELQSRWSAGSCRKCCRGPGWQPG